MVIYFGADHRGFNLKEVLKTFVKDQGYEIYDLGAVAQDPQDDYVDFAVKVAGKVSMTPDTSKGILACGSGVGVDVAANKFPRVRSVLGFSTDQVFSARHDDDANILSLSADFINDEEAKKLVRVFLSTPFGNEERYVRRLDKISQIEQKNDA